MVPQWNSARTKVQIRLSIQRLRSLQEKKLALAKKSRREIADLLLKNRVETAKLRVEGLVQEDIYVELLELLELYSEKLQARFNLLDASQSEEPEASIADAVCAIIYAAPRTDLKELQILREMLMHKYGRNFALSMQPSDPPPASVPPRILSKLAIFTPAQALVDGYLYEIAKSYGVSWKPDEPVTEPFDPPDALIAGLNDEAGKVGDEGEKPNGKKEDGESDKKKAVDDKGGNEDEDGSEGEGGGSREPAIPAPTAKATTPTPPPYSAAQGPEKESSTANTAKPSTKKVDEDDDLARRFERLKNLK